MFNYRRKKSWYKRLLKHFLCTVLDPYGRSPPFTPLGALGSGAFGGLGSPTMGQSNKTSSLMLR